MLKPSTVRELYVWHKWSGLVTSVLVFIICLSGAVDVFKEEIDRAVTPAKRVELSTSRASLEAAFAEVQRQYPAAKLDRIELLPERNDTAYVVNGTERGERLQVFVNPYTGRITGARRGETLANVLRQLHLRFYFFGFWGRVVVGVFGVTMLFSTVSGLMIYFRFMRGIWSRGLHWWSLRQGWQLSTSDLHKLVGVASLVFNLLIALTGGLLGLENLTRYTPNLQRTLDHRPQVIAAAKGGRKNLGQPRVALDEALRVSRTTLPGFVPNTIAFPATMPGALLIYGTMGRPLDQGNASFVIVGPEGKTLEQFSQKDGTTANTLNYLLMPLHFGAFAGMTMKIIYFVFGLTGAFLSLTGVMLWCMKQRRWRRVARQATARAVEPVAAGLP